MLSLFPVLLSYQQLSPMLIRLTLAAIMIFWAYTGYRKNKGDKKYMDIVQGILGVLILIGLWTQAAAALAAIGFLVCLYGKFKSKNLFTDGVNYMFILFILAVTLLFTGPGAFAFDYPL